MSPNQCSMTNETKTTTLQHEDITESSFIEVDVALPESNEDEFDESKEKAESRILNRRIVAKLTLLAMLVVLGAVAGSVDAVSAIRKNQDNQPPALVNMGSEAPSSISVFPEVEQQQEAQQQSPQEDIMSCPRDIKMCTDLSTVSRNMSNCEFDSCPEGSCMLDSMTCPDDGTSVGRNPANSCDFYSCPWEEP
jgi:hypothetical protein